MDDPNAETLEAGGAFNLGVWPYYLFAYIVVHAWLPYQVLLIRVCTLATLISRISPVVKGLGGPCP